MTGLTITALVIGLLVMLGSVALVLGSERVATFLNDRRRMLDDPLRTNVNGVVFRLIGAFSFVVGLILAQLSAGILLFG